MEHLNYKIIYSNRRSLSIILHPVKGITVRAPYRTSLKTIECFVSKKAGWIQRNLEKYRNIKRLNAIENYTNGNKLLFMGREYELHITYSAVDYIILGEKTLETGFAKEIDANMIRWKLCRWYMNKARELIPSMVTAKLNEYRNYGFVPSAISIRKMKSRWGSCSSKGRITINSELIKLRPELINYVISHELCHLKHNNHGSEFYRLLENLVPDYKALRKELRSYHIE